MGIVKWENVVNSLESPDSAVSVRQLLSRVYQVVQGLDGGCGRVAVGADFVVCFLLCSLESCVVYALSQRPESIPDPVSLPLARLLGVGRVVPGLDDPLLGGVDVSLVVDVLDADAEAVLCEDDVLLLHAVARLLLDLVGRQVDLVADPAQAADDGEEDDERKELAKGGRRGRRLRFTPGHGDDGCVGRASIYVVTALRRQLLPLPCRIWRAAQDPMRYGGGGGERQVKREVESWEREGAAGRRDWIWAKRRALVGWRRYVWLWF